MLAFSVCRSSRKAGSSQSWEVLDDDATGNKPISNLVLIAFDSETLLVD